MSFIDNHFSSLYFVNVFVKVTNFLISFTLHLFQVVGVPSERSIAYVVWPLVKITNTHIRNTVAAVFVYKNIIAILDKMELPNPFTLLVQIAIVGI